MRPMKWRMTYRYRVPRIVANEPLMRPRPSSYNPSVNAVGPGTYEVWMSGPREGEEVRNVSMVYAHPTPTAVTPITDSDVEFVYYDFTPDNMLPEQISASVQWEFTTFELYTYWEDMPREAYDTSSELYQSYTHEEPPITYHQEMLAVTKDIVKEYAPEDPTDYKRKAMGCYNYMVQNFYYDYTQIPYVALFGLKAMHDTERAWQNKSGVCDEIANVYVAMLRSLGIPARPAAGMVHDFDIDDEGNILPILAAGHAWVEFWLPDVGWVPADPTWGQGNKQVIDPRLSILGNKRQVPTIDYFFGKHDPYRVVLFKDWNYTLAPKPKTPNCSKTEVWFVGYTDRTSGVREVSYGWEGITGYKGSAGQRHGWARSESEAGYNFEMEIEMLGPPSKQELKEMIAEIEAEGYHYLPLPQMRGEFPIPTGCMHG